MKTKLASILLLVMVCTYSISSAQWMENGNAVPSLKTIGTTTAFDFPIITSNNEKARFMTTGELGIGTTGPSSWLHVAPTGSNESFRTNSSATNIADAWKMFRGTNEMFRAWFATGANALNLYATRGPLRLSSGAVTTGTTNEGIEIVGGTGADAGFVGIGDYTAFGAAHLLHVHESTPTTDVGFQVTNNATGILDTDGFLIDVDAAQVANIRQQEAQPMRFHIQDQTLMNNVVQRAEFTYGGAMRENQLTTPVDGFRIWNPGYTMSTANSVDHALDLWCGASNTTHIRFDNSGLIQTINLRFEQIARLDGFWFDAKPYTYQAAAGSRGSYFFNMDSIEISRFSNVNNATRGFMRIGLQPAGLLGSALGAINAARRLEVYDNAAVPQFRITQTDGTNYTDFQTTANGDLFIDPWAGATSRNVGIGLSTPTAKLEVNSPTVSGGSQTTVRVDNINTGTVNPTGIDVQIQGLTAAALTQATGINISMNAPLSTSSAGAYIANACNGGSTGRGIWSVLSGANTSNYGIRSDVSSGTSANYGAYFVGNGGPDAYGADIYASNGTTNNYAIKSDASGASGSADARGITTSAQGSTTNYGGYFYSQAASSNTSYGVFAYANNGDKAYGLWASASGGTTMNYGVYATSVSPSCTTGTGTCSNAAIYASGPAYTTAQWYTTSDANVKKNLQPISDYWTVLNGLNGYRYDYDTTLNSITNLNLSAEPQMGLIAQEVEAVAPELVKSFINPGSTDSTGVVKDNYSVKSINYDGVIPVLVEAIKDLKAQVDSLIANSSSQRLMNDNNTPENQSTKSETINQQKIVLSNHQGIILNQNDPNPFTESTRITFQIPDEVRDAKIIFTSTTGTIINTAIINERGVGELEVYSSELSKGLYNYTLICDGKIIATKKMVKQ